MGSVKFFPHANAYYPAIIFVSLPGNISACTPRVTILGHVSVITFSATVQQCALFISFTFVIYSSCSTSKLRIS